MIDRNKPSFFLKKNDNNKLNSNGLILKNIIIILHFNINIIFKALLKDNNL